MKAAEEGTDLLSHFSRAELVMGLMLVKQGFYTPCTLLPLQARLCYPQSIKGRHARGIVDDKQKAHLCKRRNEVKLRYHQP